MIPKVAVGTPIVWTKQGGTTLRAKVVAFIPSGTPPADLAPEVRTTNRRRVQFRDPSLPRTRDHYLVIREERKGELGDVMVYYLPDAERVSPVGKAS